MFKKNDERDDNNASYNAVFRTTSISTDYELRHVVFLITLNVCCNNNTIPNVNVKFVL